MTTNRWQSEKKMERFLSDSPSSAAYLQHTQTGLVSLKTWFTTFVQSNPYPAKNIPDSTTYMSWVNFWAKFGSVCDFSADFDSPYGCGGRPGRPYGSHTWNLGLANHWVVGRPLLGGSPAYVTLLYHQHHSWSLCSRPLFQAGSMNTRDNMLCVQLFWQLKIFQVLDVSNC